MISLHNTWQICKYPGDMAIYAVCTKCGFSHNVSKANTTSGAWAPPTKPDPHRIYRYCPICGRKKKIYSQNIQKIEYPT